MNRADRQVLPIRPTVVSTRDGQDVSRCQLPANSDWATIASRLEAISAGRPEVAAVIRGVLAVAFELALMLPRPELERLVEQAIAQLDNLDGDPDLEPIDEREPEW